jgi:tetratricopeptide (TPR) repeat protein
MAPLPGEVDSTTCAGCHAGIYRKYSVTGMARSSGRTALGPFQEGFDHAAFRDGVSGVDYRVKPAPGGYQLEFERSAKGLRGQRLLQWFIGSGRVGRSYLFSMDGFLFQSPVSYYSATRKWGISPGYEQKRTIHLTRAVEPGCLQCHASRLQPVPETENRYASVPFLEGGVSCERCHGPGRNHVVKMKAGDRSGELEIVNPAKLEPARRDSVCAQCHLTGAARIARATKVRDPYRPGALLADSLAVFTWSGAGQSNSAATSHYEKLQQSACKKASGDRLWCVSCHDPHDQPPPEKRAAFHRQRCQTCHQTADCKEAPAARRNAGEDCAGCHMPKSQTLAVEHVAFTDHSIPRRSSPPAQPPASDRTLEPFFKTPVDERDLALGYAVAAASEPAMRQPAVDLLRKAEARDPQDIPVLSQLAQLYDGMGDEETAMAFCERIVRAKPANATAAINLGTYWIKRGRVREAIDLWQAALLRNPGLTGARMNLAVAQYRSGDTAAAETTLRKALEFDPDLDLARKLLFEIQTARPR